MITLCFCKNWDLQLAIFCLCKVHPFALLHWQYCPIVSAKVFTLPDPNLMSLTKLVTNTLKHAQAPPVCQSNFPSNPSRGEARVEVTDTLLMPSAHYSVSVCVSIDGTHMVYCTYLDMADFIPMSVWERVRLPIVHFQSLR